MQTSMTRKAELKKIGEYIPPSAEQEHIEYDSRDSLDNMSMPSRPPSLFKDITIPNYFGNPQTENNEIFQVKFLNWEPIDSLDQVLFSIDINYTEGS